ncbi:LysR family transcriptional regulator [Motiliproteus sp. MSK22-1]|uniref:LysR family transcriptional regulator n=1 Tax=Motiliproteus sp. MSK22-1 TaxID=1897630 RepID=UPI000977F563|nr:LysR family transcriptional regulator [Motiliproteus sp. MSK22-1]OMH32187.1 transcriptional regulator [Motiliproteus sp. MSK22-1]
MTNDQLRSFVAVVEHGSFRAAAEHMFKTQSTVSAAVRTLEQQFDFLLLSRESYRPTLTTEGKAFYQQAKHLLAQAQQLELLGHQLAQGAAPTLSISLSAMCAIPPGLKALKRFCDQYPKMRLNITTEHLSGVLEQLRIENADLAIGPHHGLDGRYEFTEIAKVSMVTVAAPGYLDQPSGKEISQQSIRSYPHILISDSGSSPLDHVNVIPGGRRWYVNDYQMKKTLMLAGMGWARMPEHMIESELKAGKLVPLSIENFNCDSREPVYLIRLRHQPLSELASECWKALAGL